MPVTIPAATPGGDRNAVMSTMMSAVPADLFADMSGVPDGNPEPDMPIEDAPDEPITEAPDEPAAPVEEPPDEPGETPIDGVDAAAEPPAEPAAEPEELPEGVRKGKDNKGNEKYFLDESRYKTFHGDHKFVREAGELIGEPLTKEALELRNEGFLANERLFTTLESGDPAEQTRAVKFIIDEMREAHNAGEVGVDPTIPFAETVYNTLRDTAPDGYANLRLMAARDFIGEMFDQAAQSNNLELFNSAQHFAVTLANVGPKPADMTPEQYLARVRDITSRAQIPFFTPGEMAQLKTSRTEDPIAARDRRIAELESQVNGRSQTSATEQFASWDRTHKAEVNAALFNDAVKPGLNKIETLWAKFPDDYKRLVVEPLNREVGQAITKDVNLNRQVAELRARAERATSEQVRHDLGAQIKNLVINRARFAMDAVKGPILATAAKTLQGLSVQTHERRAGAQNRTVPRGESTPVRHSPVPALAQFKNGVFDTATAARQIQQALNGTLR